VNVIDIFKEFQLMGSPVDLRLFEDIICDFLQESMIRENDLLQ